MAAGGIRLFSGSSHPALAAEIAQKLGVPLGKLETKHFPCGEYYVRYGESVRGQEIFLLQTFRTNRVHDDLMELLLMIDTARQSFAKRIQVIIPYFPYSRQDKIHAPREGISARLVGHLLAGAGADHVITLQLHTDQIQGFFPIPVDNLSFRSEFVEFFRGKSLVDPVVVSPDAGGVKNAKKFADALGYPLVLMHKQRPEHSVSEVTHVIGELEGKTPILLDDMVDGGGSACGARAALANYPIRDEVYLCTTHAVFSGSAVEKLNAANFAEIIMTNSLPVDPLPEKATNLSIGPLLSGVIERIAHQQSVTNLA